MGEPTNTALMPGEALPALPPADDELEQLEQENAQLRKRYAHFPGDLLPGSWTIDRVRQAIDEHDQGNFRTTATLRRSVTKDPRVVGAMGQRTSAPIGLPLNVGASAYRGGKGVSAVARDECKAMFSPQSSTCPPNMRRAILEDMIGPGFAIAQNIWRPRPDGERVDLTIELWPIEQAYWNEAIQRYTLITTDGLLPIEHGHGKWVIFEPYGWKSWLHGAIRSLAMPWADRTYGIRYRAAHGKAHGSPAAIGELPAGTLINGPEGKAFQRLITGVRDGRLAAVRPAGSKTEYLEVHTDAWRVFDSIVKNSDEDIQLAILGQSGTGSKGNVYTAAKGPFNGVRADFVQSDCTTLEVALQTGSVRPWAAVNFGLEFEPTIAHDVPDPEEDMKHAASLRKHAGYALAVRRYREAGLVVTPEVNAAIAAEFGIETPPAIGPMPKDAKLDEKDDSIAPDIGGASD